MWDKLFRNRHGEVRVSALAITDHTHSMLRQMSLPLIAERRVKGALHVVSRDTGVSYSKLRKIYYKLTNHILAFEWAAIDAAHSRWIDKQEQKLTHDLETLRSIRAERLQGSLNFGIPQNSSGVAVARTDVASNTD